MSNKKLLVLGLIAGLGLGLNIMLYSKTTSGFARASCQSTPGPVCSGEAQYECNEFCSSRGGCQWVRFLGGSCVFSTCFQDYYWRCTDGTYGYYYDCEDILPCPLK